MFALILSVTPLPPALLWLPPSDGVVDFSVHHRAEMEGGGHEGVRVPPPGGHEGIHVPGIPGGKHGPGPGHGLGEPLTWTSLDTSPAC